MWDVVSAASSSARYPHPDLRMYGDPDFAALKTAKIEGTQVAAAVQSNKDSTSTTPMGVSAEKKNVIFVSNLR